MKIYPGTSSDYEFKTLRDLGWRGALNDMQFGHLRGQGLKGALPDMFKQWYNMPATTITGTAPVLAPLVDTDTLAAKVTWGSYSGTGTVTTTKWMKLGAGSWVTYVGSTAVATGELWQVRELCTDNVTTNWPFESSARTVTVNPNTVPATFTIGQWTLADSPSAGGDTLTVTLTTLPADGGTAITSFEYRRNGGTATALGGGLGTGARNITVVATTLANIEIRAVNAVGPGAWSDVKSATPTAISLYTARFGIGADQGSGTGAFDTNLYTGTKPANGTYGNFSVTAGVITPNGSQTAGSYTVDNWPVQVINGYKAIATQGQWDAVSSSDAGKTLLIREGAGLTVPTSWGWGIDFNWATVLGDGGDPRLTQGSGFDSRKHFVSYKTFNQSRVVFSNLRFVTGSTPGTKIDAFYMAQNGGSAYYDIHVVGCLIIASRPDPYGDYSGGSASFPGGEGIGFGAAVKRVSIRDNVVIGAQGGSASIALNTVSEWVECVGNHVDLYYADAIKFPDIPGIFGGNLITRPMPLPGDTGNPHSDGVQYQGAQTVLEASAFWLSGSRGAGDSIFSTGNPTTMLIRNVLVADNALYPTVVQNGAGMQVTNYTWLPEAGSGFPLSNPQGGIELSSVVSGTNDITNSIFRLGGSSNIHASVVQTGNVDAQTWVEADWNTAYPNWSIGAVPTLQNAIQYHAAPSGGGAAAGKGANQNITSWGTERSSYVLNYTTPTVSSISLTVTTTGFTGTMRTDVGNNAVFWVVIPQAQGNPTWREIKERRVANALDYGINWCSRAAAGTDLAITAVGCSAGVAYKLCIVAENGYSIRSAITTANFTTTSASISKVAVGAAANANSTSIGLPIPTAINGDYFVAVVSHDVNRPTNTPSGWTFIGDGEGWTGGAAEMSVYGRVRDGSEGATLTVTNPVSGVMLGFVAAYRGTSGVGATATGKAFGGNPMNSPTLTATNQSCIIHIWTHADGPKTETMPNPGDLVIEAESGAYYLSAENQLSVSAGTTTSRGVGAPGGATYNAMQIELLKT